MATGLFGLRWRHVESTLSTSHLGSALLPRLVRWDVPVSVSFSSNKLNSHHIPSQSSTSWGLDVCWCVWAMLVGTSEWEIREEIP